MASPEDDRESKGKPSSRRGGSRARRWLTWAPFVLTAAVASLVVHASLSRPWLLGGIVAAAVTFVVLLYIRQVQIRRSLAQGDLTHVVAKLLPTLKTLPHRDTMAPIALATLFAAHGQAREARATMATAQRGPVWDGAIEHRLFVEALLALLEGDFANAKDQVAHMATLPEASGPRAVRSRTLREAMGSLTRAFARESQPGDVARLEEASKTSPSVSWIMRYGAAIAAVDHGDVARAARLIESAPAWPAGSRLRDVHAELTALLSRDAVRSTPSDRPS